jgi:hypothetical protein
MEDMSEADTSESSVPAPGAADWLSLAAAPTFAMMALLTSIVGGSAPETLCMSGGAWLSVTWLTGMVPMYLLMSAFHSAAWLKLIFGRRACFETD